MNSAFAMLVTFVPLSFVLAAVTVVVRALPMSHIVKPIALVDFSVGVDQSAPAICFIITPEAFE